MKKDNYIIEKIVLIFSVFFMALVNVLCYYFIFTGQSNNRLIPFSTYVLPTVHGLVFLGTIYICFRYNYLIQFFLFQIESIVCILSSFGALGIFLFHVAEVIIILNRYEKKDYKIFLITSLSIHIICIVLTIFDSWTYGLVHLFSSLLMMICFLWFYEILKVKFACFTPTSLKNESVLSNIKQGSNIFLSDYGLTERQINFVFDYINNGLNYKDLSDKYYVSLSTVKKEFTDIYKIFNVTKLEELHILLLQYVVDK